MANIDIEAPGADEAELRAALRDLVDGFYVLASSAEAVSHTGNTSETALASVTIPAGLLGLNGILRIRSVWSVTNSANNKTLRTRFGNGLSGTVFGGVVVTTSASVQDVRELQNRGVANAQVAGSSAATFGSSGAAAATGAIDTSAEQTLTLSAQLANSGETITLERYCVEVWA